MDLPAHDDRLNSWKEIAAFLGRTVRTVQRWEKTQGLPLRRGGPGLRGAVVASKREIGEWWEHRGSTLQDEPPSEPVSVEATHAPAARSRRKPIGWRTFIAASAAALIITAVSEWPLQRDAVVIGEGAPRMGRLFAASTSEERTLSAIPLSGNPAGIALSPSGSVAYVSLVDRNAVAVVDLHTRTVVEHLAVVERPGRIVVSRDGHRLVIAGRAQLGVFDLRRRELSSFLPGAGTIRDVHLTADGRYVWITLAQEGLKVLDLETGKWERVSTIGCPIGLATAPRSRRVFVSYQCGGPGGRWGHDAIEIIDEVTRTSIASRAGPPLVGSTLAVSPDEQHLWVDTADACALPDYDRVGCPPGSGPVLHALRAATLEPLLTVRIPAAGWNTTPIFFPDGSRVVTVGAGLRVVDRPLGTVRESIDRKTYIGAFSADERRFVVIDGGSRALLIFEVSPPPDSTVMREIATHWTGDGTANDVVGGTHPVATESPRFEAGKYGQAFAFDQTSPGVSFGRRLNADIVVDKNITYAAWIKLRRAGVPLHIASRTSDVVGWRWFVTAEGHPAFCRAQAAAALKCGTGSLAGRTVLQPDRWVHLAVVRDDSSLRLFVDGREETSMPLAPESYSPNSLWVDAELRLGAGPGGVEPFQGLIDEVLLFGRSLTKDEIAQVMRDTSFVGR